jgi:hypothetical protein
MEVIHMITEHGVRRYDLGELRKATRTPQGFLQAPGFATRTGVFPYRDASGKMRYELRHPDDVMDPESLVTLKNAPFTIEHPPDMITPENVAEFSKGHTTERVEVNRDMVDVDVIIEHADAIDMVESGQIRELSSGYHADIIEEEGVYMGTPYNFRQKNIRYNHLAGVKRGRAGPEVRLRVDSADAVMDEVSKPTAQESSEETSTDSNIPRFGSETPDGPVSETKKVVILGKEVDLPSDVADAVQDMLDRYDEMRAQQLKSEEEMAKKNDTTDVDVSQPGVSPQVKVVQAGPDGRKSAGKTGPGDKSGPAKAKGDDEEGKDDAENEHGAIGGVKPAGAKAGGAALDEDEKDDATEDPAGHEDFEAGAAAAGGGAAMSPVDQLKQGVKDMYDGMMGKIDAFASSSMGTKEAKPDRQDSAIEARVEKRARARASLERQAEKFVPASVAKKFDSMSDDEIRKSVIVARQPGAKLEGKSAVYLESRFDSIVESLEDEGTSIRQDAGRRMLGLVGKDGRTDSEDGTETPDPAAARLKMIKESRELHKGNLSAFKK